MTRTAASACALFALATVIWLGAPPTSLAGSTLRPWHPDMRTARAFAGQRAGDIAFAVHTPTRRFGHRAQVSAHAASVVKAMLMVAYLRRGDVRARKLQADDRALLTPMIRWSQNRAASIVRDIVGHQALYGVARRARMRRFTVGRSWGASRITAADQARFFLRIDRLIPGRHRGYGMRLLNTIVGTQRWGIARARPRAWGLYFKGGWGSGTGAVDHQVALLRRGQRRVSVAILTTGSPSKSYAEDTLRGIARRLLRGLRADSVPR